MLQVVNSWDISSYMPVSVKYVNVYKKKSQIVPEEICKTIDTCPICLSNYKHSDVVVGSCGHCLHKKCFVKWLASKCELIDLEYTIGSLNHLLTISKNKKLPLILCPVCRKPFYIKSVYKVNF